MSKAEELSQNRYPTMAEKYAFIDGYEQAEKDLALTWEDFALIRLVFDAIEASIHLGSIKIQPMTKEYYKEVLKQFKDFKERKQQ